MFNTKNTKQQGNIGIGSAIAHFTSLGWIVSVPLNDSQDYDLVVDYGVGLKRVQVKTTKHKTPCGSYKVSLRTCGGNQSWNGVVKFFDNTKVEYLYVLCESGSAYLIPTIDIQVKSSITLDNKYKDYKLGGIPFAGL